MVSDRQRRPCLKARKKTMVENKGTIIAEKKYLSVSGKQLFPKNEEFYRINNADVFQLPHILLGRKKRGSNIIIPSTFPPYFLFFFPFPSLTFEEKRRGKNGALEPRTIIIRSVIRCLTSPYTLLNLTFPAYLFIAIRMSPQRTKDVQLKS